MSVCRAAGAVELPQKRGVPISPKRPRLKAAWHCGTFSAQGASALPAQSKGWQPAFAWGRRPDGPGRAPRQEALANGDPGGLVRSMPRFAALGPVFKSSAPASLTEEETEYSISAVKHVFARHLLLQFTCTNTVAEQVLENVSVTVDLGQAVRTAPALPMRSRLLGRAPPALPCGLPLF